MATHRQYGIWYWAGVVGAVAGAVLVLLGIGDALGLIAFDTNPVLYGLVLIMAGVGTMRWARDRAVAASR